MYVTCVSTLSLIDVNVRRPDEKSIITQLVAYYHYFSKLKAEETGGRKLNKVRGRGMSLWQLVIVSLWQLVCCVTMTVGVLCHCGGWCSVWLWMSMCYSTVTVVWHTFVTVISGVLCHSDRGYHVTCLFIYESKWSHQRTRLLIVLNSRDASLFAHMWVVCYRQTLSEVGASQLVYIGMRKRWFSRYELWLLARLLTIQSWYLGNHHLLKHSTLC